MNSFFKQFIFVGSLLAVGVQPVFAQALEWAKEGTLACIGNHALRQGGSEITFTGYTFRNFNTSTSITIDSITIFDADGRVLSTMTPGSFPSGFNDLIGPNQTAHFNTRNVFGNFNIKTPGADAAANDRDMDGQRTRRGIIRQCGPARPQEKPEYRRYSGTTRTRNITVRIA